LQLASTSTKYNYRPFGFDTRKNIMFGASRVAELVFLLFEMLN